MSFLGFIIGLGLGYLLGKKSSKCNKDVVYSNDPYGKSIDDKSEKICKKEDKSIVEGKREKTVKTTNKKSKVASNRVNKKETKAKSSVKESKNEKSETVNLDKTSNLKKQTERYRNARKNNDSSVVATVINREEGVTSINATLKILADTRTTEEEVAQTGAKLLSALKTSMSELINSGFSQEDLNLNKKVRVGITYVGPQTKLKSKMLSEEILNKLVEAKIIKYREDIVEYSTKLITRRGKNKGSNEAIITIE